jgi:hypothetical protein
MTSQTSALTEVKLDQGAAVSRQISLPPPIQRWDRAKVVATAVGAAKKSAFLTTFARL